MIGPRRWIGIALVVGGVTYASAAVSVLAASTPAGRGARTLAGRAWEWPSGGEILRVVLLEDYNTRIVVLGVTLLGAAGGIVGSFTLLRKRALMGDALSHATLPGICLAYMIATWLGGDGKSLPLLLLGATLSGVLGVAVILLLRRWTRLKEDTALGAVLSVFFGAGAALLRMTQEIGGNAAGLEGFIYGKTASLTARDAELIAAAALFAILICGMLFKELKLLCFDEAFASSRGMRISVLDAALMAVVVVVTIVGLQAVGLVLVVALLVIPAAAARFWTETMWKMVIIAAALGGLGGMFGAEVSALFSKLPSGAMVVLVYTLFFAVSLICGTQRGVLVRGWRRVQLNRKVRRQHLLRAMYETLELRGGLVDWNKATLVHVPLAELVPLRSWSLAELQRTARSAARAGLVRVAREGVDFTEAGLTEAARLTRQHRLWELYLIRHADVAASVVDREADAIEHVLEPPVIAELESLLSAQSAVPVPSPHALPGSAQEAAS